MTTRSFPTLKLALTPAAGAAGAAEAAAEVVVAAARIGVKRCNSAPDVMNSTSTMFTPAPSVARRPFRARIGAAGRVAFGYVSRGAHGSQRLG